MGPVPKCVLTCRRELTSVWPTMTLTKAPTAQPDMPTALATRRRAAVRRRGRVEEQEIEDDSEKLLESCGGEREGIPLLLLRGSSWLAGWLTTCLGCFVPASGKEGGAPLSSPPLVTRGLIPIHRSCRSACCLAVRAMPPHTIELTVVEVEGGP